MISRILPWIVPVMLLFTWQLAGDFGWLSNRILPTPIAVFRAGVRLTASGELAKHFGMSFQRAIIGFLIGSTVGLTMGIISGASRVAELVIDSTLQMLRTIPHLALIPLIILWLGVGESAKIFLVAIGVLFPIYLNTYYGVRSVDPGLIEMGRVYGLSRWGIFRRVLFPGAMPSILVGFRFSLGVMWLTLIVAETIAATSGIGYMAMNAREFLQTDIVVLSIIMYALLGKMADTIARQLERYFLPWHPSYSRLNQHQVMGE